LALRRLSSIGASRSRRRLHPLGAGLLGRARIERRLRVVFEHQLDRLGDLLARQLGGDGEAEVDAGGDAAAEMRLRSRTTRSATGMAPKSPASRATPSGRPSGSP
jgi:hypothetical protein